MRKIFSLTILALLIAIVTFIIGYSFLQSKSYQASDDLLLANNSLIARFNPVLEKNPESPLGIFKISNEEAEYLGLPKNGNRVVFYNSNNGNVRFLSLNDISAGNLLSSSLLVQIKPGLHNIQLSPDGRYIVGADSTGYLLYDLEKNKSTRLGQNIKKIALSKNIIAYFNYDVEKGQGNISLTNYELAGIKDIYNTHSGNLDINWVGDNKIALTGGINQDFNYTFLINTNNGDLEKIFENKQNLELNWSSDGENLIFSSLGPSGIGLSYWDLTEKKETPLDIPTDAHYCAWKQNNLVYCLTRGSVISLANLGASTAISTVVSAPIISEMDTTVLAKSINYLILRNSRDNKLYGLSLKQ